MKTAGILCTILFRFVVRYFSGFGQLDLRLGQQSADDGDVPNLFVFAGLVSAYETGSRCGQYCPRLLIFQLLFGGDGIVSNASAFYAAAMPIVVGTGDDRRISLSDLRRFVLPAFLS